MSEDICKDFKVLGEKILNYLQDRGVFGKLEIKHFPGLVQGTDEIGEMCKLYFPKTPPVIGGTKSRPVFYHIEYIKVDVVFKKFVIGEELKMEFVYSFNIPMNHVTNEVMDSAAIMINAWRSYITSMTGSSS